MMENRDIVKEPGRTTLTDGAFNPVSDRIKNQMPDLKDWYASEFLTRPITIGNFTWDPTQTRFQNIARLSFPQYITSGYSGLHANMIKQFTFFRYKSIKLKVQLNSTKFHQGMAIASVMPFNAYSWAGANVDGKYQKEWSMVVATQLPRCNMNASQSTIIEITIPFMSPENYLSTINLDEFDDLFTFSLDILNPLVALGTCVSTVSLNVVAWFEEPVLAVPIKEHTVIWTQASGLMTTLSEGYETLTDVAGNIATGDFRAAVGKTARYIAGKAGYDKPIMAPVDNNIHPISNLAHGKGVAPGTRLGLMQNSSAVTAPEYAAASDEMNWLSLIMIKALIKQVSWPATATNGTQLFSIPLTPQVRMGNLYDNGNHYVSNNTLMSWVAEMFLFWRGSLEFTVEVVSTSFQTGRLAVVYNPDTNPSSTLSYDDSRNLPLVMLDIQESTTFTFSVPFYSSTRYKAIYNAIRSPKFSQPNKCLTGYIHFYVMNQLRAPCTVSPDIELNVYLAAGKDFAFAVPTDNMNGQRTYIAPAALRSLPVEASGLEMHSSPVFVGSNQASSIRDNVGRLPVTPTREILGGIKYVDTGNIAGEPSDMKTCLHRLTPLQTGSDGTPTLFSAPTLAITNSPKYYSYNSSTDNTLSDSFLSRVSEVFVAWNGSIRVTVLVAAPRTSNQMLNLSYNPGVNGYAYNAFQAAVMTSLSQQNGYDVELPFQTQYNILLTGSDYLSVPYETLVPIHAGHLQLTFTDDPGAEQRPHYVIFICAGDDFCFHWIIPPTRTYGVPEAQNALPLFLITTL